MFADGPHEDRTQGALLRVESLGIACGKALECSTKTALPAGLRRSASSLEACRSGKSEAGSGIPLPTAAGMRR
ncbi:MAG: hypothetical protein MZV64_72715 [Ignavibacteriales bacterium]|nr:hypothetical protein [Ignavibacteriales bacterium]